MNSKSVPAAIALDLCGIAALLLALYAFVFTWTYLYLDAHGIEMSALMEQAEN